MKVGAVKYRGVEIKWSASGPPDCDVQAWVWESWGTRSTRTHEGGSDVIVGAGRLEECIRQIDEREERLMLLERSRGILEYRWYPVLKAEAPKGSRGVWWRWSRPDDLNVHGTLPFVIKEIDVWHERRDGEGEHPKSSFDGTIEYRGAKLRPTDEFDTPGVRLWRYTLRHGNGWLNGTFDFERCVKQIDLLVNAKAAGG